MAFDYNLTPREQARLDLVTEKLTADAKSAGLTVSPEQIETLPSVRLFVLSDHDVGGAMNELLRIPEVAQQARRNEMVRQLEAGEGAVHAELARMPPWQRLNAGRELEKAKSSQNLSAISLTAEQEAERILLLRSIKDAAQRLTLAREWGMA